MTLPRSAGTVAALTVGLFVALMAVSNIAASLFWDFTGGLGLLDLDGGRNIAQPEAGVELSAQGTPERISELLGLYSSEARGVHAAITLTLDLVFPLALALSGVAVTRWFAGRLIRGRRAVLIAGAVIAWTYAAVDWSENLVELLLLAGASNALVVPLTVLTAVKLMLGPVVLLGIALAPSIVAVAHGFRAVTQRGVRAV